MDPWKILDTYFRDHMYPFTKHHLDSYHEFMKTHIPNTIQSYNPITMIKTDNTGKETLRVDVYVGGKDGKNIYIERPTILDKDGESMLLTPQEARLRNLTYASHLYVDLIVEYTKDTDEVIQVEFPMTYIGSIPLMLHSDHCILHGHGANIMQMFGECPMDPGGYFIIEGKEKVIVSQERITTNRLFISKLDDPNLSYKAMIRCTGETGETALSPRTVEFHLIKDPDTFIDSDVKEDYRSIKGAILVQMPSVQNPIPLTVLFRALGIETDKQIVEAILGPIEEAHPAFIDFIRPSIAHGASVGVYTMTEAHEYLKPRVYYNSLQHVRSILTTDLFPNMPESLNIKGMYLGYLIQEFMKTALHISPVSDRDSYVFKRVDISGYLLAQLFQETYSKFRKYVRDTLDKEYHYGPWKNVGLIENLVRADNLARLFPSGIITDIFTRSLKGMWGPIQDDPDQGLVQDLSRISYIGFLSHLRRVNMPLDRSIKIVSPHRLHAQQWGIMCPFESPDGASIGYLKNFAILTQITFGTHTKHIVRCFEDLDVIPITNILPKQLVANDTIRVFINGTLYGITYTPKTLVDAIRIFRRNGMLNPFVSVSWNIKEKEIRVQTEAGRPCRPLFILENNEILAKKVATKSKLSWFDLIFGSYFDSKELNATRYSMDDYISPFSISQFQAMDLPEILNVLQKTQACVEYLDIEEENTRLVAMKEDDINTLHTHLEIHPSTLFSIVTQIVPFANHNQAPRVIFHGAQSKQAIGIYATNFNKRFDTNGYIQHYPQKSIVSTRGSHYNGNNKMPNGCNVIVAVCTYTGFNQEDGIIINKTSVERGLFHLTGYKTVVASEKTLSPNERLIFANPIKLRDDGNKITNIKKANYTLLNNEGVIKEESYIPRGQEAAIVGMVHIRQNIKENRKGLFSEQTIEETYHDVSLTTDQHLFGTIDRVFMGSQSSTSTQRICKVRFRKVRKPELGDKHCLTPDHEVLTKKGWKYIQDITKQDYVYVLKKDGTFGYEKPYELYTKQCNNETLYQLQSQQVDLCVTMDHNMWVRKRNSKHFEIIKAKEIIGKRVSYAKSAINENKDYQLILPKTGKNPEFSPNMKYFLEFFGFWISDGWASIYKRQREGRNTETIDYIVEICQVKKEDRERLIEIIKLLGYTPTLHGSDKIKIANRQLCEFLLPLSVKAPNKYLPEWVWELSQEQARYLYDGLRRGDGHVTRTNSDIYYSSSYKLANDVQRLALHAGWSANIKLNRRAGNITKYKEREIVSKYDQYSVNIVKNKNTPTINHGHIKNQNGQKESLIQYDGKVYCIEVPSHVFYVRRNGKPVWTGNCSRHGQKGVVGMVIPQENMPFNKDGIVPDLIINPHAFPSRMTIGHLVETVTSKLCCYEGTYADGTVFDPFDANEVYNGLEKLGLEKHGNEILYNGRTGEQLKTEIFFGPIYYYRLKHMVADKINARGDGPRVLLTHQPTSGRRKGGGLRIGEMERDTILSHGLSQFVKECMMEKSDKYTWSVCKHCGTLAVYNPKRGLQECTGCKRSDLTVIETPYTFKLLIQELEAMGLQMRISSETIKEIDEELAQTILLNYDENQEEQNGGYDVQEGMNIVMQMDKIASRNAMLMKNEDVNPNEMYRGEADEKVTDKVLQIGPGMSGGSENNDINDIEGFNDFDDIDGLNNMNEGIDNMGVNMNIDKQQLDNNATYEQNKNNEIDNKNVATFEAETGGLDDIKVIEVPESSSYKMANTSEMNEIGDIDVEDSEFFTQV